MEDGASRRPPDTGQYDGRPEKERDCSPLGAAVGHKRPTGNGVCCCQRTGCARDVKWRRFAIATVRFIAVFALGFSHIQPKMIDWWRELLS